VSQERPDPMTLVNTRRNGVRAVTAVCVDCKHKADVVVDQLGGDVFVPEVGRRLRCSACGGKRVETVPAWHLSNRPGMGY